MGTVGYVQPRTLWSRVMRERSSASSRASRSVPAMVSLPSPYAAPKHPAVNPAVKARGVREECVHWALQLKDRTRDIWLQWNIGRSRIK